MKVRVNRAKGPVSKIDPCSWSISGERIKTNAIECTACKAWVHKRCLGVRGVLTRVKDYECGLCKGLHDDEEEVKYAKLGNDMTEVIEEFCYLGDVVRSSGDVQSAVTARIRAD